MGGGKGKESTEGKRRRVREGREKGRERRREGKQGKGRKKEKRMRKLFMRFVQEEDGIGVVEMILILVVLIGLVIIFKSQLTSLVNQIFDKITSQSGTI